MVTGRRAFGGQALLGHAGGAWSATCRGLRVRLVAGVPHALERLIQRCLRKGRGRRSQHISDVKVELLQIGEELDAPIATRTALSGHGRGRLPRRSPPRRSSWPQPWASMLRSLRRDSAGPVTCVSASPCLKEHDSPRTCRAWRSRGTARRLVVAAQRGRNQELYVRELAGSEWKRLPGNRGDRRCVLLTGRGMGRLLHCWQTEPSRRRGGTPQTVCGVTAVQRGTTTAVWGEDGWITYAGWPALGFWRCPAAGGAAERLSETEPAAADRPSYTAGPKWLSGGRAVLFGTWTRGPTPGSKHSRRRQGEARRRRCGRAALRTLATGHLLHRMGQPDSGGRRSMRRLSPPVQHRSRWWREFAWAKRTPGQRADYALSDNGTLVYVPGRKPERRLVGDRSDGPDRAARRFRRVTTASLALSPDGDRVAIAMTQGAGRDIWIGDLGRGSVSRVTEDDDSVFTSLVARRKGGHLHARASRGSTTCSGREWMASAPPIRLTESAHAQRATSWSPDGRLVLFNSIDPEYSSRRAGCFIWMGHERRPRC